MKKKPPTLEVGAVSDPLLPNVRHASRSMAGVGNYSRSRQDKSGISAAAATYEM
jgi:hypothetical protein